MASFPEIVLSVCPNMSRPHPLCLFLWGLFKAFLFRHSFCCWAIPIAGCARRVVGHWNALDQRMVGNQSVQGWAFYELIHRPVCDAVHCG